MMRPPSVNMVRPAPPPETPAATPPAAHGPRAVPDPYGDVDINLVRNDEVVLDIGGIGQVLGLAQPLDDPGAKSPTSNIVLPALTVAPHSKYSSTSRRRWAMET